ncbi:MAG: T9SS type A sorting domain-containing protein, partial [Bacteroidota bacterium]
PTDINTRFNTLSIHYALTILSYQCCFSNYANPFARITTINFGLGQRYNVSIRVSNLFGQTVFEMTENGLPAGTHAFNFDASNLSNGVYIYTINAVGANGQNYVASKKMILSK